MQEILGSLALWPAQQVVSSLVGSDPQIKKQLEQFAGKTVQISATSPFLNTPIDVCLIFEGDNIRLSALDAEKFALPVDALIKGSTQELLQLLFDKSDGMSLVASGVAVEGDTQLVQDIFTTMKRLDLNWQDYLAPIIGDIPTHELGKLGQNTGLWAQQAQNRLHRNVDDYLKEELRLFPQRIEIENFNAGVDDLRLRLDRLQARIKLLDERLTQHQSS